MGFRRLSLDYSTEYSSTVQPVGMPLALLGQVEPLPELSNDTDAPLALMNVFVPVTSLPALVIQPEVLLLELIPEVARHVMLLRLEQS